LTLNVLDLLMEFIEQPVKSKVTAGQMLRNWGQSYSELIKTTEVDLSITKTNDCKFPFCVKLKTLTIIVVFDRYCSHLGLKIWTNSQALHFGE